MASILGFDNSALKKATCKGCAAIVQYSTNEIQSVHGTDYGGGPDGYEYIQCPNCSKRIITKSW